MKLITLGDSITRGTHIDDNGAWAVAQPNFSQVLAEGLSADELVCLGLNGVSVSRTSTTNPDAALSILCDEAIGGDIVVIAGGTNDYGTSVALGKPTDREDNSFYGGLHVLYTKIRENNPKAKVFVVLPIRRKNENNKNEAGHILDDYRAAICSTAKAFGYTLIDGRNVPIDPENAEQARAYIRDGLHPNTKGHALYGEYLITQIKKEK